MRRAPFFLALVIVGLLAACHRAVPPAPRLTMQLATQPAVPPVGRDTTFTLTVRDRQGRAVEGGSAKLSLRMTFMDMGETVVQLSDRGHGVYSGAGTFSMGGDWDVRATVLAGGATATQVFHYKVG